MDEYNFDVERYSVAGAERLSFERLQFLVGKLARDVICTQTKRRIQSFVRELAVLILTLLAANVFHVAERQFWGDRKELPRGAANWTQMRDGTSLRLTSAGPAQTVW